jgi:hypothetical protein
MSYVKLIRHGLRMMMPFLDSVATRALVAFGSLGLLTLGLSVAIVAARAFDHAAFPAWSLYGLLLVLIALVLFAGNLVVLFAIYAQSQGSSLRSLWPGPADRDDRHPAGGKRGGGVE